jgi:hypothetical protein
MRVSFVTCGGDREEETSGNNAAAAAAHRRHRRALVLVGETVALADRQLFHRNLRRRRPFGAAAPRRPALRRAVPRVLGARLGDRARPARRVERRLNGAALCGNQNSTARSC